ncbi:hypothetical protein D9615_004843 [Tricholomella constricta]|uniref:BTB domain-containing protein n=1 Tax=Tricholomella constricta TaxID=117010 RepID=A0A8H5HH00_9AGAR|nr:hypothetical protein D9615_004843 [Tricholomella constricta]
MESPTTIAVSRPQAAQHGRYHNPIDGAHSRYSTRPSTPKPSTSRGSRSPAMLCLNTDPLPSPDPESPFSLLEEDITMMVPEFESPVDTRSTAEDPWALHEKTSPKTRDSKFYMTMAVFEVEDSLFRVPTHYFRASTEFFNVDFDSADASGDECHLKLEDVTQADFRALLNLMYPRSLTLTRTLSDDEWVSVLKLSTNWMMLDVRRMAIEHLTSASIPPADRVILARTYNIADWLRSAYIDLADVSIEVGISPEDAAKIGLESTLKLYRSRDSVLRIFSLWVIGNKPLGSAVDDVFGHELQGLPRSSIEKVLLARTYNVAEWLRSAYVELVERKESLTIEEAATLGYEAAIRLGGARERRLSQDIEDVRDIGTLVDEAMEAEMCKVPSHTPVDRVILARENGVSEWLRSALVELMVMGDMSLEDGARIGLESAIALYRVREKFFYSVLTKGIFRSQHETAVDNEFGKELEDVRAAGDIYCKLGKAAVEVMAEVLGEPEQVVREPVEVAMPEPPTVEQRGISDLKRRKKKRK